MDTFLTSTSSSQSSCSSVPLFCFVFNGWIINHSKYNKQDQGWEGNGILENNMAFG